MHLKDDFHTLNLKITARGTCGHPLAAHDALQQYIERSK